MILRALNPQTELHLFRQSYSWRPNRKRHLQPDRMSFEEFSKDDPSQIVMGLFDDELIAVYMFREYEKGKFESHFSSRKGVPTEVIKSGALAVVELFTSRGGTLVAWILGANKPLRKFIESVGFFYCGDEEMEDTVNGGKVNFCRYEVSPSDSQGQSRLRTITTNPQIHGDRLCLKTHPI